MYVGRGGGGGLIKFIKSSGQSLYKIYTRLKMGNKEWGGEEKVQLIVLMYVDTGSLNIVFLGE